MSARLPSASHPAKSSRTGRGGAPLAERPGTTSPAEDTPASFFDDLRRREFGRLERTGQVYLDYTGGGLFGESQIRTHLELLTSGVWGNPHSVSPASAATTELVEAARRRVLAFFRASEQEYEVVFTANASGALKLVGESYPFSRTTPCLLTYDNHNSVNGIREYARAKGGCFEYVPITDPDLRIDEAALRAALGRGHGARGLFAYPAQSNFSGVQHSLEWVGEAQSSGWDVLLDAAAFAPTNRLDLSQVHPDFVALSFYKIFGYPTGVGCLLVRRRAAEKLRRPWFAGGTVVLASAHATGGRAHGFALNQGESAFEDGTPNYLDIPAVTTGLDFVDAIGIERIHDHVGGLTTTLLAGLTALRHGNGQAPVHIYGPQGLEQRGGTVALNFFDRQGRLISPKLVEREAAASGISLRTGCYCNPGAGETALHISRQRMAGLFRAHERMSIERFCHVASATKEGSVRVSLGLPSNRADVEVFLRFAEGFREER